MVGKGKQLKSDASAPPSSAGKAKQPDSQMWTALKREDEEELLDILFDSIADAESGEVRLSPKPTARKVVNQPNAKKVMALSYAVSESLDRAFWELLLRAGAAVNKKDETAEQSTALHAACWNEDGEAVDVLLRAGADPRVVDADGRTPLHVLATSNAANLMLQLLDGVCSAPADRTNGGGDENARAASSAALTMDPIALLAVPDKAQGATVLHLALGESTYNFGVAQALCEYLEKAKDAQGGVRAVAQLVSARTTITGDSPLHALVAAANAEDAVVETLVRRLLGLGADPLARNTVGQSALEVAVSSRPGCSSKSAVQLYEALLSAILANDESGLFLTERNKNGHALIHVALAAANTSAVKALCATVPAAAAKALLGDPVTADGISVVELLATSGAGSAEGANALIAAKAVARESYESLQQSHEALQAEHRAEKQQEEDEREAEREEHSENGDDDAVADTTVLAGLKRRQNNAGSGISRAQQARRARAATAAQRKQHASGTRANHEGGGRGGLFGGELSTSVKVVGVMLLLSIVVSAYTLFFGLDGDGSLHSA
ncbi:hypothetical protein ABB37_02533 [Leptomonas pyrrhocoris]|uniref:Uncharacterized protein n=1 Tax=Leptomonas pyrrhocoris TaxID=157538 RepID=A0A0N0DX97_LEPPY|nr:hypothetical protein ABB37_02533 [Leptomonas pyrrhocoris]KPA82725.1 hypothetical protein ABB37_02533 [Leptomonas pyrrhocoris]|eukprot:XP_015661164.1 hypothetical protein ABB37_02533 [Leptomonas pyrrhocoris]